jgi:uncharacterized protein (DUF433 family)
MLVWITFLWCIAILKSWAAHLLFRGTRVPFQALIDYIEAGHPLADFLDDFPTVSREQAIAALEQAKEAVLISARVA